MKNRTCSRFELGRFPYPIYRNEGAATPGYVYRSREEYEHAVYVERVWRGFSNKVRTRYYTSPADPESVLRAAKILGIDLDLA